MAEVKEIKATIPVCSYGNIQPTITCENYQDGLAALIEIASALEGADAKKFAETISKSSSPEKPHTSEMKALKQVCFGDECLYFDESTHTYTDEDGNDYLSGSSFAHKFQKDFPRESIAAKVATEDKPVSRVLDGWDSKGEVSLLWGSTVHKAIETKITYGEDVNDPYLKSIVDDLCEQLDKKAKPFSEVFVCDKQDRLCGFIDCLVQINGKDCEIYDWKTGDIYKRTSFTDQAKELFPGLMQKTVSLYYLQLNFYRYIIEKKGYNVKGMKIWALNGEHWVQVEVPKMDITNALEAVWKLKK